MAKDNAKKENKNKKHFWKDFKAELKKVIWPTPKQLFKNTMAVVFIVIITAAIVFVLDITFDALNYYGINRLQSTISDSTSTTEEAGETEETEQTEETDSEENVEEEVENVEE